MADQQVVQLIRECDGPAAGVGLYVHLDQAAAVPIRAQHQVLGAVRRARTPMSLLVAYAVLRVPVPFTRGLAERAAVRCGARTGIGTTVLPGVPLQRPTDAVPLVDAVEHVPLERQRFALPDAECQGHHEPDTVTPPERGGDDALDFLGFERLDLLVVDPGCLRQSNNVARDATAAFHLCERGPGGPVDLVRG